jgi:ubiquinone/menaquinone biosynthesis C-methylase UbiE
MTATNATAASWDYTALADSYIHRPDYSDEAIDALLQATGTRPGDRCCDVGAGAAHLTLALLQRGLVVDAVEPNAAMRSIGQRRTAYHGQVTWSVGTGEETGRDGDAYRLVAFGSSFNVTDRARALAESHRLLRERGWFACMWNHRDLDDPLQREIEALIRRQVPDYAHGVRRQDQSAVIEASGLFGPVQRIEGRVVHLPSRAQWVAAWRSHATLQRSAGPAFDAVVQSIDEFLEQSGIDALEVPYTTRIWAAQRAPGR